MRRGNDACSSKAHRTHSGRGQDNSVTSLIAGATSAKSLLVMNGAGQPFDCAPSIGYDLGRGWPGDADNIPDRGSTCRGR